METFETVEQYEKEAKVGDRIVLNGKGLVNGIDVINCKSDAYKVARIKTDGSISIKGYKSKTPLAIGANAYDQKVARLTKDEFNNLYNH